MTTQEAIKHGRKIKRAARTAVELGDAATWYASDAHWHLTSQARTLGIVGADGLVNVAGEVARAFLQGFRGGR